MATISINCMWMPSSCGFWSNIIVNGIQYFLIWWNRGEKYLKPLSCKLCRNCVCLLFRSLCERPGEVLSSFIGQRLLFVINISQFHIIWNHLINYNQTLQKWCMKEQKYSITWFCSDWMKAIAMTAIADSWFQNLLWNYWPSWNQT